VARPQARKPRVARKPRAATPAPTRRPEAEPTTGWEALSLSAGDAVIVYLQVPKEKVWGLLVSLGTAGIVVRCIDLVAFDDWMRQEARKDEPYLGLSTVFYPMNRVERMERDQTMGPVMSYSDRFAREVGRSVRAVIGIEDPD
jgi:hypothetical protein